MRIWCYHLSMDATKKEILSYEKQILELFKESGGIVSTAQLRAMNIPTVYLTRMVKKGLIERCGRGIYRKHKGDHDEYYFFSLRYPKIIFSHLSALYLHQLTDKIPDFYEITVYSGYNASKMDKSIKVHYIKKDLFLLGKTKAQTMFSNTVPVYDRERTICDLISDRENTDIEIFSKAIQRYASYHAKNINKLFDYAEKMKISDKVRSIMELQL